MNTRLSSSTAGSPAGLDRDSILTVRDLTRSYNCQSAVNIKRLEIGRGEFVSLIGPNGAGKSTLLRILNLLEAPDAGEIRFDGAVVGCGDLEVRRRMACVFQRSHMFAGTVTENIGLGLRLRRIPQKVLRERVAACLASHGLEQLAGRDARTLSGGEVQRVALARALVLEPEVLFLDEPTGNLDLLARRQFAGDVSRLTKESGVAVLYVTHLLDEAMSAGRMLVMAGGRVLHEGAPADVIADADDERVRALFSAGSVS